MGKTIIVRWIKSYKSLKMHVIESDHPRFLNSTQFEENFLYTASEDGYTVIIMPLKELPDNER